jgi:predicted ribosome quality control (RQC) complex YloA/Tae2 family protein
MIKNYFLLNRFVIDAEEVINGAAIADIFSQERDKLIIQLVKDEEEHFLEMYVNPGQPYINLREKYSRAKKNTINLFPEFINKKIESVEICTDDRIVRIKAGSGYLYFTIRGKYTNVYADTDENKLESFKNLNDETLTLIHKEFGDKTYSTDFNIPDLNLSFKEDYFREIKKTYPVISNEIIKEAKRRITDEKNASKVLDDVISKISIGKPTVFINNLNNEVFLGFDSFGIFEHQKKEVFDDLISAQNFYLSKKHFLAEREKKLKIIQRHLNKELKKISNKINSLQGVLDKGNRSDEYKRTGELLLINLRSIKAGMKDITVKDIYNDNIDVKIKLNPKHSAKKNVDSYFNKAKAEKIEYEKSKELISSAKNQFEKIQSIENRLDSINDLKELTEIMKELKIQDSTDKKDKDDIKDKFKHYILDDKYHVFVGKDSKNNDLLTTKFAKQNDYWFHARSVSGSHVVLRVENTKEAIPKSVLKKTASLAAYHSKAKTAGTAPVTYTLKRYVIKKKGYPIGTVHLLKEEVLLVKPEIPKGCEFVVDE